MAPQLKKVFEGAWGALRAAAGAVRDVAEAVVDVVAAILGGNFRESGTRTLFERGWNYDAARDSAQEPAEAGAGVLGFVGLGLSSIIDIGDFEVYIGPELTAALKPAGAGQCPANSAAATALPGSERVVTGVSPFGAVRSRHLQAAAATPPEESALVHRLEAFVAPKYKLEVDISLTVPVVEERVTFFKRSTGLLPLGPRIVLYQSTGCVYASPGVRFGTLTRSELQEPAALSAPQSGPGVNNIELSGGDPIWNFGDGSPEVTTLEPRVSHAYAAPGTYSVTATNPATGAVTYIVVVAAEGAAPRPRRPPPSPPAPILLAIAPDGESSARSALPRPSGPLPPRVITPTPTPAPLAPAGPTPTPTPTPASNSLSPVGSTPTPTPTPTGTPVVEAGIPEDDAGPPRPEAPSYPMVGEAGVGTLSCGGSAAGTRYCPAAPVPLFCCDPRVPGGFCCAVGQICNRVRGRCELPV
eukprot:tig00000145_g8854.t1